MSNMNPEDVILSTPVGGADDALPPGHPASAEGTLSVGEALSTTGRVIEPGAGAQDEG